MALSGNRSKKLFCCFSGYSGVDLTLLMMNRNHAAAKIYFYCTLLNEKTDSMKPLPAIGFIRMKK